MVQRQWRACVTTAFHWSLVATLIVWLGGGMLCIDLPFFVECTVDTSQRVTEGILVAEIIQDQVRDAAQPVHMRSIVASTARAVHISTAADVGLLPAGTAVESPPLSVSAAPRAALPPPAKCAARAAGLTGHHLTFEQFASPDFAALRRGCGTRSERPRPFASAASRFILFEPVLSGWCSSQPRASNSFDNLQIAILIGLLSGRTVVMPPYWAPSPQSGGTDTVRPYASLAEQTRAGISYDAPHTASFGAGRASAWDPFSHDPLVGLFDIDALRRCALAATNAPARGDVSHPGVMSWSEFAEDVEKQSDAELAALFSGAALVCGRTESNSNMCGCGREGDEANANRTGSNPLLLLSARVRAAARTVRCERAPYGITVPKQNDFMLRPRAESRVVVVANGLMAFWLWKVYVKDLRSRAWKTRGVRGCVASCALTPQPHLLSAARAYRDVHLQGGAYHAIHLRMAEFESRLDELYDKRVLAAAWSVRSRCCCRAPRALRSDRPFPARRTLYGVRC